jgi:hypothetical protein
VRPAAAHLQLGVSELNVCGTELVKKRCGVMEAFHNLVSGEFQSGLFPPLQLLLPVRPGMSTDNPGCPDRRTLIIGGR